MANELTAQQRAQLFALQTRQNFQMLAPESCETTPATLQFTLPKARLLAGACIRLTGKVNLKHASKTTVDIDIFTLARSIRRISLDLNNGFQPFVLSGIECLMYNLLENHPQINAVSPKNDYMKAGTMTASATGADNDFSLTLQLPVTTSLRDPIGLILLQNDSTNVTLSIDMGLGSDMFPTETGLTADIKNVKCNVMLETFSIPANSNAFPDLSVLKLVNGRVESMPSSGQQIIKLTTGTIYRKILFRILDENGTPMSLTDLTGTIDLVFNQADVNYSLSADMLRLRNEYMSGYQLPDGMFVFDFSNNGTGANMSGTRDYIDTANLTEFWLRFHTSKKGKVELVTECLTRLA